tara:strand:+ start:698 stop:865 length:168 start_codon:yes stop_codon:yes gene_type:complete
MEILVVILIFITGIAMGLYYSSQLEEGINNNIGCCCKKEKDNYESFIKKHYKKRK